ncbi:Tetracenomycin polyketide synthesis O-methyltransferase TcmP [Colletotrichum sidae]|uniref:Tetracenomycin polyketide synthesis O-methyltransferase TcmP n=1 Tax=Colletotrichum sidae TaxID=1347389 RepID=A0A4R8T4B3_9PEZI|nr:Tetracenomycin polyketide synthesis O-methyltransferase TcmP [Colletotrichum sidae]
MPSSPPSAELLDKGTVDLTGAEETLLITLFHRAKDAESPSPVLNDRYALEAVARIRALGYDFSRTEAGRASNAVTVATRARIIDICTERFLERHPGPVTILHLACGMDSRSQRVDWQGEGRLWIDVDTKDAIRMRRRVLSPTAPRAGEYRLLDLDILSDGWLDRCDVPSRGPVLVVFEGLTMYLTDQQNLFLLSSIVNHFRNSRVSGELVFDAVGSVLYFLVNTVLRKQLELMGTRFSSYLDHPRSLEKMVPGLIYQRRVARLADVGVGDGTEGWLVSWLLWVLGLFNMAERLGGNYVYVF